MDLELPAWELDRLYRLLSPDEWARAARLRFSPPRRRFVAGRGRLREILSRYLAVSPDSVQFRYGEGGKPALAYPGHPRLEFNVAHSGGRMVCAIANRPVGIDLERVRPVENVGGLVQRFFSPSEGEVFRGLPLEERQAAFFTAWTRKEAYVKARGAGLALPLDSFDVSLAPHEPARLLADRHSKDGGRGWSLVDLDVGEGYVGALAIRGDAPLKRSKPQRSTSASIFRSSSSSTASMSSISVTPA